MATENFATDFSSLNSEMSQHWIWASNRDTPMPLRLQHLEFHNFIQWFSNDDAYQELEMERNPNHADMQMNDIFNRYGIYANDFFSQNGNPPRFPTKDSAIEEYVSQAATSAPTPEETKEPTAAPSQTTPNPTTTKPPTPIPTTAKPTTDLPTTRRPTTLEPTTSNPTTRRPTTPEPTTSNPTTRRPTTLEPTTSNPTTRRPTTPEPTTSNPTTRRPTTLEPTTSNPTTRRPTTLEPTTSNPTTRRPTTLEPTTSNPTTRRPTTPEPTTSNPTTRKPTTPEPTTALPTTQRPTALYIPDTNNTQFPTQLAIGDGGQHQRDNGISWAGGAGIAVAGIAVLATVTYLMRKFNILGARRWCPIITLPAQNLELQIDHLLPHSIPTGGQSTLGSGINIQDEEEKGASTKNIAGVEEIGLETVDVQSQQRAILEGIRQEKEGLYDNSEQPGMPLPGKSPENKEASEFLADEQQIEGR